MNELLLLLAELKAKQVVMTNDNLTNQNILDTNGTTWTNKINAVDDTRGRADTMNTSVTTILSNS